MGDEVWTVEALKQHLDRQLDAIRREIDGRFADGERARVIFVEGLSHRLEAMNDLRGQLAEQAGTFATVTSLDTVKTQLAQLTSSVAEFHAAAELRLASAASIASSNQAKIDLVLDPRNGVFSTQSSDTSRLKSYGLALLTALLTLLVASLLYLATHH